MTEKLQLPVGLPTEIIFLTEFFCAITHKKIRICQVKESVENDFPVGPSRQGNHFSRRFPISVINCIPDGIVSTEK